MRRFTTGFLPPLLVASLTMLLVLLEKDLGTTILLGTLTMTVLFVAGTRIAYVLAAALLAAPLMWQQIVDVGFRRGRLLDFLSGEHSYQIQQSLIAIGSGGPWGLGLGAGRQKLGFLPENHTDFILASIGEELGFAGICVVLALFGRRALGVLAIVCLAVQASLLSEASHNVYYAQTVQLWEQGRFARFHGLVQWLGWVWPYLAMAHLRQLRWNRRENFVFHRYLVTG